MNKLVKNFNSKYYGKTHFFNLAVIFSFVINLLLGCAVVFMPPNLSFCKSTASITTLLASLARINSAFWSKCVRNSFDFSSSFILWKAWHFSIKFHFFSLFSSGTCKLCIFVHSVLIFKSKNTCNSAMFVGAGIFWIILDLFALLHL